MTAFLPSFDTLYSSAKGNIQGLKNMQGVAKYQLEEQISKANFLRKWEKYEKKKLDFLRMNISLLHIGMPVWF